MKLIVVTPNKNFPDETGLVTKMFESGLSVLHLRKAKYTTEQLDTYIQEIPEYFHNRIVIHSHHKLAIKYNLKGIHLTRTHLSKKWKYFLVRLRLRLKFGLISKSRSYSNLQQLYSKEDYNFDYFLLGTIFNNLTGEFYAGYNEDNVIAALKHCGKKAVARGGTKPDLVKKVNDLGFYGIAFNSYLWNDPMPFTKFMEIIQVFKSNNIELE
jgi:thiamine-phosphate pyrophosphorylase